jgi:diamine N-acetyltransferase
MAIVRLSTTTDADLDFVEKAESDPDTSPFIVPWPRHRHTIALGDPDIAHRIAKDEAQNPVGFVILAGLTNADSSIEFRRIVVVRKGEGCGRLIVRAVKELAFNELRAHRLWLDVKAHNARARSLYKSEGFSEEGLLRECIRGPVGFESLVVMALLRHELR